MKRTRASELLLIAVSLLLPLLAAGCRSAFVSATITNHSGSPLSLIEVDYPSASFGVGSLAAGATYSYRFKIQGSGQVKIQFTDGSGKTHSASGPDLAEGAQGSLGITIGPVNDVSWVPNLSKIR
jgi:hypothetical protein